MLLIFRDSIVFAVDDGEVAKGERLLPKRRTRAQGETSEDIQQSRPRWYTRDNYHRDRLCVFPAPRTSFAIILEQMRTSESKACLQLRLHSPDSR